MKIHHQGWNETAGAFNRDVTINEERSDHEICFPDGTVFRQQTPFETMPLDLSQPEAPSPVFGAFFSHNGVREFFTPLDLASLVLNGYAVIPGLQIEEHQDNLVDRIVAASQRSKCLTDRQPSDPAHPFVSPVR